MLTHTIIDPGTVMIILFYAYLTYLTMIATLWPSSHTFQAYFLCVMDVFSDITFGLGFDLLKQS